MIKLSVVIKTEKRPRRACALPARIYSKELNPHPCRRQHDLDSGPRRAFEVTCAIQFSKIEVNASPRRKRRTGNLASKGWEVKLLPAQRTDPCSRPNIGAPPRPANPPA